MDGYYTSVQSHCLTYLSLFHFGAAENRWAGHGETDKDGDGETSELHFRYGFLKFWRDLYECVEVGGVRAGIKLRALESGMLSEVVDKIC